MKKTYTVRESAPEEVQHALRAFPKLLRELLFVRGITTHEAAATFCAPEYAQGTYDPFLLKDMDIAIKRIIRALEKKERIAIYSDYDTDGIPGGVILHDCFKKIGYDNFTNYIPHRNRDGFGLNKEALAALADDNVKLVITIDCGIGGIDEVAYANQRGLDVIITDHHLPGTTVPDAVAIINPKQDEDTYPFKELCGAAVAFKLTQALLTQVPTAKYALPTSIPEEWQKWLLDMVGIATISDMVPLLGENRIFATYGLQVVRKSPRVGLQELMRQAKIRQAYVSEDDVGFMIGPRINAASRMDAPEKAFTLLATTDPEEAYACATDLQTLNDERKGRVAAMVKAARKKIVADGRERLGIVVGEPGWQPGLLGLVANKLAEEYGKPTFVWGRGDAAEIKGSCRSGGSVDVVTLMEHVNTTTGFFTEYGGHSASGGFGLAPEHVDLLSDALHAALEGMQHTQEMEHMVSVDARMHLDEVTWETMHMLDQLAPFGVGNPKPLFMFEKITVKESKHFGKEQNHLELAFENTAGKKVTAIGFFMTASDFSVFSEDGEAITLIATLEKSYFRGRPEVRLRIVDIV